jgi:hypothetical protein
MGQKIYFVLAERDIALILRGLPEITHEDHVKDLFKVFGSVPSALTKLYQESSPSLPRFIANPTNKPMALLAEDILHKQLLPLGFLSCIEPRLLDIISSHCKWENIPQAVIHHSSSTQNTRTVRLQRWTQEIFLDSMITGFFGEAIWALSPTIKDDLLILDANIWKLFFGLPRWLSKDTVEAQERLRYCLVRYVQLPESARLDRSWSTKVGEEEMRARSLQDEDIACVLLSILWGYVSFAWAFHRIMC